MEMSLAQKYGGAVPRYTSYPTAPHFSTEVGAGIYADWLGHVGDGDAASLYMHVPFCQAMCWYCGCFTKVVNRYGPVSDYVNALLAETDIVRGALGGEPDVRFIHWGGGSPTILSANDFGRIVARLHRNFRISDSAEIALEMDPRTTTQAYVRALAHAGVNRVSIGVQDFDLTVQQAINRVQPFDITARVVDWLRDAGINAVNLDLMYGLPYQTEALIASMTEKALSLAPTRIALFGYAHVPWMKAHQRLIDEAALPDLEARWRQAKLAADMLQDAGYVRIGLDHFAHPDDPLAKPDVGAVRRNFQGYTTDDAGSLIGFGASAIGTLPNGYVQNVASIKSYRETVSAGKLATVRGLELSTDDRLRRAVIEQIMCALEVDLDNACRMFGVEEAYLDEALASLQPLAADDLVEISGRRLRVTERGRPLVRTAAAVFDSYLSAGKARHSAAV